MGAVLFLPQITQSFRPSKMNTTKTVCILSLEYHGNNDVSQASPTNTRITIEFNLPINSLDNNCPTRKSEAEIIIVTNENLVDDSKVVQKGEENKENLVMTRLIGLVVDLMTFNTTMTNLSEVPIMENQQNSI